MAEEGDVNTTTDTAAAADDKNIAEEAVVETTKVVEAEDETGVEDETKVGDETKLGEEKTGDEEKIGEEMNEETEAKEGQVGEEEIEGEGKEFEASGEEVKEEVTEEAVAEETEKKKKNMKTVIEINEYGEEVMVEVEEEEVEETKEEPKQQPDEEVVEEEEIFVEPPPPDPAAPYDLSDSKEVLRPPFELNEQQLAELEQLWQEFQDHTPAYSDIDGYITQKELVYMLKSLILMPYTPEQLIELIDYYVRPPHPNGHISYEQFVKIVKHRQRDMPVEEELKCALKVMDFDNTGSIDRELLKEVLSKKGYKMGQKQLIALIKEVDISNDGTIGVEDVVGTMCIDLNSEDIQLLRDAVRSLQQELSGEAPPDNDNEGDDED